MNTLVKVFAIVIAACALVAGGLYYYVFQAGDKTPLESLVPKDALFYADVKETRKLALELTTSSYGKTFAEMGKLAAGFLAMAKETAAAELEKGEEPFEFPAIDWEPLIQAGLRFNRQIAFFTLQSEVEELPFHAYAIAHYQGDADSFTDSIQEFLDNASQALELDRNAAPPIVIRTETIDGLPIRYLPAPQAGEGFAVAWDIRPCWTTIDNRWYAGLNPQSLAQYIRSLEKLEPSNALQADEAFAQASQFQAEYDSQAFLNLERLVDAGLYLANQSFGAQVSQAGISIDLIVEALGLQELKTTFYAVDFRSDEILMTNGLEYRKPEGLLSLYTNQSPLKTPSFIPSDAYTANSVNLDLGETILLLKDIALKAAPMVGLMYPNYKQMVDQQLGQDAEAFLANAFESEFHTFSTMSIGKGDETMPIAFSQSQVYAAKLTDSAAFQALLDLQLGPLKAAGILPLVERKVGGFSMNSIGDPNNPLAPMFGYAIADDLLFLAYGAGPSALDSLVDALGNLGSDEGGAYQAPEVSRIIAQNQDSATAIALVDLGIFAREASGLANEFRALAEESGEVAMINGLSLIDWSALEDARFKMVSVAQSQDGLLLTTSKLFEE